MYDKNAPFPMDWDEWVRAWAQWKYAHRTRMEDVPKAIPGKNFLADEIIGTYKIDGRIVELSGVTFPNLSERDPKTGRLLDHYNRFVGVTFKGHDGEQPLAANFKQLEEALGL